MYMNNNNKYSVINCCTIYDFEIKFSLQRTYFKGQGGPQGPTLKIKFLEYLDTRKQELLASCYPIKNIIHCQNYGLSKLGLRLYLQYAQEFQ